MSGPLDTYLNGHSHPHTYSHALIPNGVADYFWDAAATRRELDNQLLALFHSWRYETLNPPTLEYADTFDTGYSKLSDSDSTQKMSNMIRFLDHDGQPLALRYDMTMAIARLVGTRLHDAPMPQRFCYASNVFRTNEHQPGRLREFGQVGVELIGANTTDADAEVLALTARALQSAGLDEFRIALGQMRFFHGILDELALSPPQVASLTQAIERRSEPALWRFLHDSDITQSHQETLRQLLQLNGNDSRQTLVRAREICLNQTMEDAVNNLQSILDYLAMYDLSHFVHLDLTEVSDMGYYTGIRFMAYAPGVGGGIAGGGRYDNLIGTFGPPQPAVGMGLGIERIIVARQNADQTQSAAAKPLLKNHVLVSSETDAAWVNALAGWREAGIRVVIDVNGRRGEELHAAARAKGISVALSWTGNGFEVFSDAKSPSQGAPGTEELNSNDIQETPHYVTVADSKEHLKGLLLNR